MAAQREEKERQKARREKIGGYFLDMSKLTFGTMFLLELPRLSQSIPLPKGLL